MSMMGGRLLKICLKILLTPPQEWVSITKRTRRALVTRKWLLFLIITTVVSAIITTRVTLLIIDLLWLRNARQPIHRVLR